MLKVTGNILRPRLQRLLSPLPKWFTSQSSSDSDSEVILLEDANKIRQNQKPFIRSYLEIFKYVPLTEHIFTFSGIRHVPLNKLRQFVNFIYNNRNSSYFSAKGTNVILLYLLPKKLTQKTLTTLTLL